MKCVAVFVNKEYILLLGKKSNIIIELFIVEHFRYSRHGTEVNTKFGVCLLKYSFLIKFMLLSLLSNKVITLNACLRSVCVFVCLSAKKGLKFNKVSDVHFIKHKGGGELVRY